MNSFGNAPASAPWGQIPTAQQPWSGGPQWDAASQAPWRLSPWSTQGMPSGGAVAPPPVLPQLNAQSYLPQGTSAGLQGFDPQQAGGGFYPGILSPDPAPSPAPAPAAPPAQQLYQSTGPLTGGQVYSSNKTARAAANRWNNQNIADSGEWHLSQGHAPLGGWFGEY